MPLGEAGLLPVQREQEQRDAAGRVETPQPAHERLQRREVPRLVPAQPCRPANTTSYIQSRGRLHDSRCV